MNNLWQAKWITDGSYHFTEENVSPIPMKFRKRFQVGKPVKQARIYATAMGIYALELNGEKVGDRYFAPGFTSYETRLQYQVYDVTELLQTENTLTATVSGGWAVGSFTFLRKNRITADRQALLLALHVCYADETEEIISTDESWHVTQASALRMADLYDGEIYDATVRDEDICWRTAAVEILRFTPNLVPDQSAPVKAHERMKPISCKAIENQLIYDFGQNFAGVVCLRINGGKGQTVTVRHAEILKPDGTLNTDLLRTAKATVTYIC